MLVTFMYWKNVCSYTVICPKLKVWLPFSYFLILFLRQSARGGFPKKASTLQPLFQPSAFKEQRFMPASSGKLWMKVSAQPSNSSTDITTELQSSLIFCSAVKHKVLHRPSNSSNSCRCFSGKWAPTWRNLDRTTWDNLSSSGVLAKLCAFTRTSYRSG